MPVNVLEFLTRIGKTPPPKVILFCPFKNPKARDATYEPLLAERAVDRLVAAHVEPEMKDLAYAAYYADETKPREIVLEAQTLPFLTERRVVLIRNAEYYNTESGAGPLWDYLESPNDTTLMILVATHVDRRTRFFKACEKNGLVVECPALNERDVKSWVRTEVEARGKTIEPGAIDEIVRRAGTHLSDVNNAIGIVTGFVGEAQRIREQDVIAACADVAEEEVWTLTDAIAASNPGAALGALRRLMDLGKVEDELIGTINWMLKSAYAVATAKPSTGPPISAFVAKKFKPLADKLGVKKLRDAFALCTDTHFMIRSTGVDGPLALELLVVKLAAPRQQRRQTEPR